MGRHKTGSTEAQDKEMMLRIERAGKDGDGAPFKATLKKLEDNGDNQKIIAAIIKEREIANHADLNNIDTLYECLRMYLQHCMEDNVQITNAGAYAACKVSREIVYLWANGRSHKDDPRYAEFANTIRTLCTEYREAAMSTGKLNPIIGIWWQKVYEGYRDNEEVQHESGDLLGDGGRSASELSDRYDDMPD